MNTNTNEYKNKSLSSPLQMVLSEILLKLKVCGCIFNLIVCLKKNSNVVRVSSWFDTATHIVVEEFQVHASLIFENHVAKDNTACHDVLQVPLVSKTSRTTNNGKPRLQNPECFFNVFSAASCTLANSHCFLVLGPLMLLRNVHQEG